MASDSPAGPTERLTRILRGPVQRIADAWGAVQPNLADAGGPLAAAMQRGDADLIAFEYRRLETFHRQIGALLVLIDATLDELAPLADDATLVPVHARIAVQVRSLGGMKRTLATHLRRANRLEAKATAALRAARRRDASTDVDWERLQARLVQAARTVDGLVARMAKVEQAAGRGAARTSTAVLDRLRENAAAILAEAPVALIASLRAELLRIGDAVVVETTSRAFAAQFQHEKAGVEAALALLGTRVQALRTTVDELARLRIDLDLGRIAQLLGVPLASVRGHSVPLADTPSAQLKALASIADRHALDRTPRELLGDLRREGLVA